MSEWLDKQTEHIDDPITRNNVPLFSQPVAREKSRVQQQIKSLKNEYSIFLDCILSHKSVKEILKSSLHVKPDIAFQMGNLRSGTKSDLVSYLENFAASQINSPNPTLQVMIIDGVAVVNMLRPGTSKTLRKECLLD